MARTVEDCALVMNAVAGYDPNDPTSLNLPRTDFSKAFTGDTKGLHIGVVKEFFEAPMQSQVRETVSRAIHELEGLGAVVFEVSWPIYRYAMAIASIIQMAEATAYHSHMIKENGAKIYPPARLRLEAGVFISATDYVQAQRARVLFYRQSLELLRKADVLAGPTVPVTAFPIGTSALNVGGQEVNVVSLLTQYTRPFNLNGFPAITVPCGFSNDSLPIGLQLIGRPLAEETLLRVAHAYEQATDWHCRRPPL